MVLFQWLTLKNIQIILKGLILSNLAPINSVQQQQQNIQYFEDNTTIERKRFFEQTIAQLPEDLQRDPESEFTHLNIRMQAQSFYDFTFDSTYLWQGVYNNFPVLEYLFTITYKEFDTPNFIKNFNKPVLLLLSEFDFIATPPELWDPIIQGTKIKVHKLTKSGHNPMLEEPEEYFKQLNMFTI